MYILIFSNLGIFIFILQRNLSTISYVFPQFFCDKPSEKKIPSHFLRAFLLQMSFDLDLGVAKNFCRNHTPRKISSERNDLTFGPKKKLLTSWFQRQSTAGDFFFSNVVIRNELAKIQEEFDLPAGDGDLEPGN